MKRNLFAAFILLTALVCRAGSEVPVIITAGQSNADGRVPIEEMPSYIHYDYCQWSYGSGDFLTATGKFSDFRPTVGRTALAPRWGFDAVVYYDLEQVWKRPFYVIKHTMGGTAIDTACTKSTHGMFWSADPQFVKSSKSLLRAMTEQIDACLKNLPKDYDIKFMLWHQGESDMEQADRYYDNVKAVVAHVRQHLAEVTSRSRYARLPVVCGTFAKKSRQGSPKVADALRRLAREDENFHVVEATDLSLQKDQIHFDARGAETLGKRVFEKIMEITHAEAGDAFKGIWPVTDRKKMRSLNGEWQLKVVKGIGADIAVPAADASWRTIPVPGCWEAYGFCKPKYSLPDSLTGYYRTEFTVPKDWKGEQVIIRLDGVLRGYDLWLNNQYVGTWQQAYNTCLFDLTPYLSKNAFKGERQQLSMRVYSRFKGFEFDCFDDWAPMGIFRDVTLFSVPSTHLSDLTVETKMNGQVNVKTAVANATKTTTVEWELASGDTIFHTIPNPRLWTAETPYLYTLRVRVKDKGKTLQTFEQKIGIREMSIEGNILKLNGKPIKLRGVTCHSTDPQTVKVVSDELTLKDMHLMKEASVNYIRTSHYPREPRFYDLADSLGFYVVNEVPMGSCGEKNLSKPDYQDVMRRRVAATMPRDKNHASVIVWSIGNENPLPESCQRLGEYAKTFDATRPICYPQKGSYFRSVGFGKFPKVADIYAPHYPTTSQLRDYYTKTDRPLIFTEYCHTLGISFEDHDRQWNIIEHTPGIAGGSVWEWADQGMPFSLPPGEEASRWRTDGSERDQKVYTSTAGGFEMQGNFGTDGLLYADRTPLPNYYELQHNYARAFVSSVCCDTIATHLTITNRYDFLDLKDNVTFHWAYTADRDTVAHGSFSPSLPPSSSKAGGSSCIHELPPLKERDGGRLALLHITAEDAQGHTFLRQSFLLGKPSVKWQGSGSPSLPVQEGPLVRTGRKATMAERITQKGRLIPKYLLPLDNRQVKADVRTTPVDGGGEETTFTLSPDTADVFRAELGLAFLLDKTIDRVQWMGYGPFASYPGRHQACRYGLWAMHRDDLYFEGNHGGVDAALFTDREGNGLLVVGDSLDLNFEQTDRGIVMTVNAAVSGQGPKFAKTAFNGWSPDKEPVSATFRLYRIDGSKNPSTGGGNLSSPTPFTPAASVPAPFNPFITQYDTYLLRYNDIVAP